MRQRVGPGTGSREILGDFPDVARGVDEAGGAHSPWPVLRPVEQRHAVPGELSARCVHVVHLNDKLGPCPGIPVATDAAR